VQTKLLFTRPFEQVEPGLGVGMPTPAGWYSIAEWELLIFVGFSGVGKTTTLDLLMSGRDDLRLLPDRRVLVDKLVIEQMQVQDGANGRAVNRLQRYEYMFRYRAEFPGGLGHAITQLYLDPACTPRYVVFNGLRGENEVGYAIESLPQAKFIWLDAPRFVRIRRMLRRNDPHDRVSVLRHWECRKRPKWNFLPPKKNRRYWKWCEAAKLKRAICRISSKFWSRNAAVTTKPRCASY
jgi:hypothetical protein